MNLMEISSVPETKTLLKQPLGIFLMGDLNVIHI